MLFSEIPLAIRLNDAHLGFRLHQFDMVMHRLAVLLAIHPLAPIRHSGYGKLNTFLSCNTLLIRPVDVRERGFFHPTPLKVPVRRGSDGLQRCRPAPRRCSTPALPRLPFLPAGSPDSTALRQAVVLIKDHALNVAAQVALAHSRHFLALPIH